MKTVDAKGLVCPVPIIKTKKALRDNDTVKILTDDETALENLRKMAQQLGYEYSVQKENDQVVSALIKKESAASVPTENMPLKATRETTQQSVDTVIDPANPSDIRQSEGYIVVVNTNVMGRGDDKLGGILLKSFIYSFTEQDVLPERMIFYNGGVKLLVDDSDALDDLKDLAAKGVKIIACGTCVDYYGLKDQIHIGEITNMFRIVELMRQSQRIVKP